MPELEDSCRPQKCSKQDEWVWEYVLKNCSDFRIPRLLSESTPIPETGKVKKMMLLKLLNLDMSARPISDRCLQTIDGLYDHSKGGHCPSDAILPKFELALRKELALQHLRGDGSNWEHFSEALNKHWDERVQDTEIFEALNEEKQQAKLDLSQLQQNHSLKPFILSKYKWSDVKKISEEYFLLAWKEIGPIFLEKAEEDVMNGKYVPFSAEPMNFGNGKASEVANAKLRKVMRTLPKSFGVEKKRSSSEANESGDHLVGEKAMQEEQFIGSPEVRKAQNELKESVINLKQQVKDPLPEAIAIAEDISKKSGVETDDLGSKQADEKKSGNVDYVDPGSSNKKRKSSEEKFSIMNRSATARTIQWDDEGDDIEDSSPDNRAPKLAQIHCSSISPLAVREPQNPSRRRKIRKWSKLEEDTLKCEVQKYGKGRWKFILQNNKEVFSLRSEVDLKDKWRNIERSSGKLR